jgi:hypothetical protein
MDVAAGERNRLVWIAASLDKASARELLGRAVAGNLVALAGGESAIYMNDIRRHA